MSEPLDLPANFDLTTRLFPLPNVVFFPAVTLPLHVFEPRYRQMTADSLATDKLITMALLRPGWEAEYDGRPPLYTVGCIGKIIGEEKLKDGRYNLMLRGLRRVRILHEPLTQKPYRSAKIELLEDLIAPPADLFDLASKLVDQARRWFKEMGIASDKALRQLSTELPANLLSDVLAFALPLDLVFKQQLLEELSIMRRTEQLGEYLESHGPPSPKMQSEPETRQFPPEFSSN